MDVDLEDSKLAPVLEEEGLTYVFVRHNNLYLLGVTDVNASAAMVVMFLYKVVEVMTAYFTTLEEESLRDNFVIVYELLDEICDFGYPQSTDPSVLKEYITQHSHKLAKKEVSVPSAVTGAVSWRAEGIKHSKNEVFLDVVENVNLLVASNGTLLRSEIDGRVKMNIKLSGMPELRLGLNDRVQFHQTQEKSVNKTKAILMDDVTFHQCVKLSRFESDRTISFIPPEGEFELMSYRLNTQVKPLIWIEALVEKHAHSRVELMVKAKAQFKARSSASNVSIIVPVPPNADTPKFKTTMGKCSYKPEIDAAVWEIKQFQGGREFRMRAHFGLPSIEDDENPDKRPPIKVKFEIPYFTVSGIQVRFLKVVERSGYQALPWISISHPAAITKFEYECAHVREVCVAYLVVQ